MYTRGPSTLAILSFPPRCISTELDGKRSKLDTDRWQYKCWYPRQWPNPASQCQPFCYVSRNSALMDLSSKIFSSFSHFSLFFSPFEHLPREFFSSILQCMVLCVVPVQPLRWLFQHLQLLLSVFEVVSYSP